MNANQVETVGVVGAGTMGNGIAHVFALTGIKVQLVDAVPEALEKARASIEKNLARQISKNRISADDAREALDRVQTSTELNPLAGAAVVVEAVPEHRDLKAEVFGKLDDLVGADSVLASNTSSISITELAAGVSRPNRFIGMHFMNPVPVMQLVEVIKGLETDDQTVTLTVELCQRLGKTPVEVNDYPGFVANRLLMPMLNEAIYCLMEGVAEPEAIDTVM
ncbi:MAG: 3-hydroxyacyl-CoA dehydrogenase family protein, partial [Planctomycetota bacterium]